MISDLTPALRPLDEKDVKSIAKNANNIHVWNNVRDYFPHPYSEENAREFIEFVKQKPYIQDFAIDVNGEAIGCAGFIPGSDVERISAEIGYWIGEPYWGKGITTDIVRQLVKYVFDNTNILRLFAVVFENNRPSMRVLEKTGFNKLTVLHKAAVKNGEIIDLHYFELLK